MKKVQGCGNCKFQKVDSKVHPCNACKHQASGYITSMWKKK